MPLRKVQNVLAAVIILGALVGLFFQSKIEDWWQRRALNHDRRAIIGRIESLSGDVKIRKPESLSTVNATTGLNLRTDDSVLTEGDQSVVISFNSGLKIELEPHSTIVITDTGPEMIFLKGHIKVLNQVSGISLPPEALTKDDVNIVPPPEAVPQVEKKIVKIEKSKGPVMRKKVDEKTSLPDGYISSIIRNQKTFLNRCYAQHLRLDPDTQGRIDTSLVIEKDGSVSTARVVGSTIADPQLQQCIVGTLQRAKFKSFAGDPIVVNYPITFD